MNLRVFLLTSRFHHCRVRSIIETREKSLRHAAIINITTETFVSGFLTMSQLVTKSNSSSMVFSGELRGKIKIASRINELTHL